MCLRKSDQSRGTSKVRGTSAVLCLQMPKEILPEIWLSAAVRTTESKEIHAQDVGWPSCKKYMGNVDAFLKSLLSFDKDNIPEACVDKVEKDYIKQPYFTPEAIRVKSAAAGGLCGWVVNICKYFHIYQVRSDC